MLVRVGGRCRSEETWLCCKEIDGDHVHRLGRPTPGERKDGPKQYLRPILCKNLRDMPATFQVPTQKIVTFQRNGAGFSPEKNNSRVRGEPPCGRLGMRGKFTTLFQLSIPMLPSACPSFASGSTARWLLSPRGFRRSSSPRGRRAPASGKSWWRRSSLARWKSASTRRRARFVIKFRKCLHPSVHPFIHPFIHPSIGRP